MSLREGHSLSEGSESPNPSLVEAPMVVVVRLQMLRVDAAVFVEAVVAASAAVVAVADVAAVVAVPASGSVVVAVVVAAGFAVVVVGVMPYSGDPSPAGRPVGPEGLGPPAGCLEKPPHPGWDWVLVLYSHLYVPVEP